MTDRKATSGITPPYYLLQARTNELALAARDRKIWNSYEKTLVWFACIRIEVTQAISAPCFLLCKQAPKSTSPINLLSEAVDQASGSKASGSKAFRRHLTNLQNVAIDGDFIQPTGEETALALHTRRACRHLRSAVGILEKGGLPDGGHLPWRKRAVGLLNTLGGYLEKATDLEGMRSLWHAMRPKILQPMKELMEHLPRSSTDRILALAAIMEGPVHRVWHELSDITAIEALRGVNPKTLRMSIKPVNLVVQAANGMIPQRARILWSQARKKITTDTCSRLEMARSVQLLVAFTLFNRGKGELYHSANEALDTISLANVESLHAAINKLYDLPTRKGAPLMATLERNDALAKAQDGLASSFNPTKAHPILLLLATAWMAQRGIVSEPIFPPVVDEEELREELLELAPLVGNPLVGNPLVGNPLVDKRGGEIGPLLAQIHQLLNRFA